MVNQPSYNPNDRDQLQAGSVPQPRRHRHLRAGLERQAVHHRRGARLGPVPPRQRGRHLAGIPQGRHQGVRGRAQSRRHRSGDDPRQVEQRRHRQGGAVAQAGTDLEHAHRPRVSARSPAAISPASRPACSATIRIGGPIGIATLSHGYGLSVTPLQLAHAYATIGAGGMKRPMSFERVSGPVAGERVMDREDGAVDRAAHGAGGGHRRHRQRAPR